MHLITADKVHESRNTLLLLTSSGVACNWGDMQRELAGHIQLIDLHYWACRTALVLWQLSRFLGRFVV